MKVNDFNDHGTYKQVCAVDMAERNLLIGRLMGDYSLDEFAENIGCTEIELVDALYGKNPASSEFLWKVAAGSDITDDLDERSASKSKEYIFNLLLDINGMVVEEVEDEENSHISEKSGHDKDKSHERQNDERQMKNAIYDALLNVDGAGELIPIDECDQAVRLAASLTDITVFNAPLSRPHYHAYSFFIPEGRYTGTYPVPAFDYSFIEELDVPILYERATTYEVQEYFKKVAGYLLMDMNNPGMFRNVAMSFVFDEAEMFEAFNEIIGDFEVNSDISIVLISDGEVVKEEFLLRKDGKLPDLELVEQ